MKSESRDYVSKGGWMAAVLSMYMDICRFFFGSGAKKEHNRLDCIKKQQVASPPDGHGVSVDGQKKYISRFFLFHARSSLSTLCPHDECSFS